MSKWIDISNYTRAISLQQAQAIKALGWDGVIVGLQYPPPPYDPGVAHQQIQMFAAAGLRVQCYAESQRVQDVWYHMAPYAASIERIWQACEEDFVTEAYLDAALAFIDGLGLREPAGIYTGAWWWRGRLPYAKYADRDLWVADYDGHVDLFGGWARWRMWQYHGSTRVAGIAPVDLNEMVDYAAPMPTGDDMTEQETRDMVDAAFAAFRSELGAWQTGLDIRLAAIEAHFAAIPPVVPPPITYGPPKTPFG